jgi:hypothetical protein
VAEIAAALAPPRAADGVLVIFFQAPERCHTCATMRRLTNETVAAQFAAEQEAGRLAVRVVDLAVARYAGLRAHPALAFSTVGLLRFKNHRATNLLLLTEQVWSNYRDDAAFHTMLGDAIRAALAQPS